MKPKALRARASLRMVFSPDLLCRENTAARMPKLTETKHADILVACAKRKSFSVADCGALWRQQVFRMRRPAAAATVIARDLRDLSELRPPSAPSPAAVARWRAAGATTADGAGEGPVEP